MGFGDIDGPKPCRFMGFGDIEGPKPRKNIEFGDVAGPKPCKLKWLGDVGALSLLRPGPDDQAATTYPSALDWPDPRDVPAHCDGP